jgi:hypothetical protein
MNTYLSKLGFLFVVAIIGTTINLRAFTAIQDGDWTDPLTWGGVAPTGTVNAQDIIIPSGIDVNMNIDVTFNGLLNNFTVDGTLTTNSSAELMMLAGGFNGTGDVTIDRIEFQGLLTTYGLTGDLDVKTFVNNGVALNVAGAVTVTDSLSLAAGTLTLATGANLVINTNATIVRDGGSLVTTGGVFNSAANYNLRYLGGNKTAGIESNSTTLQNLYIDLDDNSTTVTLGNNVQVHGILQINSGILAIGSNDLDIMGNISMTSGTAISSTASSTINIQTSTALTTGLSFTAGSSLDELNVNFTGTGNVKLESDVAISNILVLENGTVSIESGSTLTMNAGSMIQINNGSLQETGGAFNGSASYDVEYLGSATTTSGEELTGTGLNDVEVNMSTGHVTMSDDVTVGGELYLRMGKLDLNGNNLTLNGTLRQDGVNNFIGNMNSDLNLNITTTGDDTIYFDGSNQNIAQFTLNATGGDILLYDNLHIHDELIMTSGNLIIRNNTLTIEQNADITGYSETRYIKIGDGFTGKLEMYITANDPYLTFPVGTEDSYSPAHIQQMSGATSGMFSVGVFNGVYVGGNLYAGYNSATTASVVDRTWTVESSVVTVNMNLKLGWMASDEVNGFDRSNAHISHYTAGAWDMSSSTSAVSGSFSTYEITRTGLSTLSPFAVADDAAELIIDEVNADNIKVYPNPCTEMINVSSTDITDQYTYQITDMTGKIFLNINNGTNSFDVSSLPAGFYLLKMTNIETQKSTVKEFIKK